MPDKGREEYPDSWVEAYRVKNKTGDERKFRDDNSGRDVYVEKNGKVVVSRPPHDTPRVWKIRKLR